MTAENSSITPVDITDHEGSAFAAGSITYLYVADEAESQALDGASYDVVGQRPESLPNSVGPWVVDYLSSDRSRITLQEEDDGRYLAKLGQGADAEVVWDYVPFYWIVWRGEYENSFALSNDQGYFLRAWSDDNDEGALCMGLCVPSSSDHDASERNPATSWVFRSLAKTLSALSEEQRSQLTSPTIVANENEEVGLVAEIIDSVQEIKAADDPHLASGRESEDSTVIKGDGGQINLLHDDKDRSAGTREAAPISDRSHRFSPPMIRPPNHRTPQDMPPQDTPTQSIPPQTVPPQSMPPQTMPPQVIPSQIVPPQVIPPQRLPSQTLPPQSMPPQSAPSRIIPPQRVPPQAMT